MDQLPRPFAVVAPPPLGVVRRNVTDTETRLARNVAGLFGVEVPGSGTGMRWVCDYNELTIGEIGRGAPSPDRNDAFEVGELGWHAVGRAVIQGPAKGTGGVAVLPRRLPGGLDEVARATVQRYGPDTKAALILMAADHLFSSILPVMEDVLEVLGTSDDGLPAADATRICIWAAMIADAFREQPALFNAAVRARAIQQAAMTPWEPDCSRVGTPSRAERRPAGAPMAVLEAIGRHEEDSPSPYTLRILDEFLLERVKPRLTHSSAVHETDASSVFLGLDLIARWMRHILHSSDRAVTWLRAEGDVWWSEAYLPEISPLATFIDDVQRQNVELIPFVFDYSKELSRVTFNRRDASHRKRLRPRVPSLPEIARLDEPSRRAALNTHITVLRILRECPSYKCSAMERETVQDAREVVDLAARLFGPLDPLTLKLASIHLRMERRNRFDTSADPFAVGAAYVDSIERLHEAWQSVLIPDSWWIESVYSNSATLNLHIQDLAAAGQVEEAEHLFTRLRDYWREALPLVGLEIESDDGSSRRAADVEKASSDVLPGLLHNYVGMMAKSPRLEDRLWAIEIGMSVLLPLRRRVGAQRNSDNAVRLTLQVMLRSIDSVMNEVPAARRSHFAGLAEEALAALSATTMYKSLVQNQLPPDNMSDLTFLTVLATTLIMLSELGEPLSERLSLARNILTRVEQGRGRRVAELNATSGVSEWSMRLVNLKDRLSRLEGDAT